MHARYDEVVIFCPSTITGGPEALHQLAFKINQLGGSAKIAYFAENSSCEIKDNLILCSNPSQKSLEAYKKYLPVIFERLSITDNTLLIFPEISTQLVADCGFKNVALWWLSVDHAIAQNQNLKYESFQNRLFSKPNLINFYQSEYAKEYLISNRARTLAPLFDYIDRSFFESLDKSDTKQQIALFPRKGAEIASVFVNAAKDLSFKLIQNMSTSEVIASLRESLVYIDFGHHPGRDRVPREAIASNAIIFVNTQGSAKSYLDYPLDNFYKFSLEDVLNGSLEQKVRAILSSPQTSLEQQSYFKQKIFMEEDEFTMQVQSFFFIN